MSGTADAVRVGYILCGIVDLGWLCWAITDAKDGRTRGRLLAVACVTLGIVAAAVQRLKSSVALSIGAPLILLGLALFTWFLAPDPLRLRLGQWVRRRFRR